MAAWDGAKWIAVVLTFVHIFFGGGVTVLFYWRREYYPIQPRYPLFCLIHQVTTWATVANLAGWILNDFQGSCLWFHFLFLATITWGAAPYLVRVFQLYFRSRVTSELLQQHQETVLFAKEIPKAGWFTQRQRFISPKYLAIECVVLMLNVIPLCAVFYGVYPEIASLSAADPQCPPLFSFTRNTFYAVFLWTTIPWFAFLLWKARNLAEQFWLRKEMAVIVSSAFLTHTLAFIPQIDYSREVDALFFPFMCLFLTIATFVIPVYLSYGHPRRARPPRKLTGVEASKSASMTPPLDLLEGVEPGYAPPMSLSNYLQHPEHYLAFSRFLAKEFAVENLLFWRDVMVIRGYAQANGTDLAAAAPGHVSTIIFTEDGTCSPSSNVILYQMLQLLRRMYIEDKAPQQINVSWRVRQETLKRLQSITPQSQITVVEVDHCLKRPVRDVLDMLEGDTFLRFMKSHFYVLNHPLDPSRSAAPTAVSEKSGFFSTLSPLEEKDPPDFRMGSSDGRRASPSHTGLELQPLAAHSLPKELDQLRDMERRMKELDQTTQSAASMEGAEEIESFCTPSSNHRQLQQEDAVL